MPASTDQRFRQLESRLAAIEKALRDSAPARRKQSVAQRFWVLEGLRQSAPKGGAVTFAGTVDAPDGRHLEWQWGQAAAASAALDWTEPVARIAALAHPVRLQLLQAIYRGTRRKVALEQLPGLGTTGQLYHHLRELDRAGWIHSPRRGEYEVPADRVVPLLVLLAAAGLEAKA